MSSDGHSCCSPAARIRRPVWPGRWTALTESRPSASTTASATGSSSTAASTSAAGLRRLEPDWAERLGDDHTIGLERSGEISDTALTRDVEIADGRERPAEHLRARPQPVFLTFAAALAYRRGLRHIVGGMCETDYSGYPDCRDDTIKALQVALNLGMERRFVLHTPLMWIDKAATWRLAHDLGGEALVELIREATHTCYLGERRCTA